MTVKSSADIVAEMISAMKVSDPEVDTSIGSFVRKILDVVAEQIAPAYAESYLIDYTYSVDTKAGADLDDFCEMFGISRMAAKRASGVVTFSRPNPAANAITIPSGTQISTGFINPVVFATVAVAVLAKGTTSISVPVQAVDAGQAGNLPSDALTNLITPLSGISSTTAQSDATTGGVDAESDDALKQRFKRTIFRSMAGTKDMFLGVALEDSTPDDVTDTVATQATVIGASSWWREQVQIQTVNGSLTATSTIPPSSIKHIYSSSVIFGPDVENGEILTEGIHFTFDGATPPVVTGIGNALEDGRIYDLQFEYVPQASRNDPDAGISNRVDIWVAGVSPQQASETTYYRTVDFTNTTTDATYVGKFVRMTDSGPVHPVSGNKFLQLAWGPILTFPEQLTIGGTTYTRDTDYWVVHDDTGSGYSPSSLFGLEWRFDHQPALDTQIALTDQQAYFYNRLPADVEARAERWKLVTTDVKAHAAKQIRVTLNFAVMYDPAYERGMVQASLDQAMAQWMDSLGFRSVVQVSDILQMAHNVAGVDNIRLLNSLETSVDGDPNSWGIQQVNLDGTNVGHFSQGSTPDRASDIVLAENEVVTLYDVRYVTKAQNSWSEPH